MRHAAITGLLVTLATLAIAQQPTFEVASIKANASGDDRAYSSIEPGGRFVATNVRLIDLVLAAYRFKFSPPQITGGPAWVRSDHFNVEAKPGSGVNPTEAQIPEMLRALLVDRFKLGLHEETRQLPIYALVKTRSDGTLGPQLTATAAGDCVDPGAPPVRGPRPDVDAKGPQPCGRIVYSPLGWRAKGVTADQIAKALEAFAGRPVENRSDLVGTLNVVLEFTPQSTDTATSIFTAVREQLGLRLDARTNAEQVLVIDRAERPAGN